MEMYKIELHTSENQLEKLDFLFAANAAVIGGAEIRQFETNRFAPGLGDTRGGADTPGYQADTRIEVFIADLSPSLLRQLVSTDAVLDLRVTRCTTLDFAQVQTVSEEAKTEQARGNRALPESRARCLIEPGSAGGHRLKIEGPAGRFFLGKLFGILGSYRIPLLSGQKFRQGTMDYAKLTIGSTNSALLSEIATALSRELDGGASLPYLAEPGRSTQVSAANCMISLEQKGNLYSFRISATADAALMRQRLHALFCEFNVDISIGRMLTRGDTIEDTYHLRILAAATAAEDLLSTIRFHLSGE